MRTAIDAFRHDKNTLRVFANTLSRFAQTQRALTGERHADKRAPPALADVLWALLHGQYMYVIKSILSGCCHCLSGRGELSVH